MTKMHIRLIKQMWLQLWKCNHLRELQCRLHCALKHTLSFLAPDPASNTRALKLLWKMTKANTQALEKKYKDASFLCILHSASSKELCRHKIHIELDLYMHSLGECEALKKYFRDNCLLGTHPATLQHFQTSLHDSSIPCWNLSQS